VPFDGGRGRAHVARGAQAVCAVGDAASRAADLAEHRVGRVGGHIGQFPKKLKLTESDQLTLISGEAIRNEALRNSFRACSIATFPSSPRTSPLRRPDSLALYRELSGNLLQFLTVLPYVTKWTIWPGIVSTGSPVTFRNAR